MYDYTHCSLQTHQKRASDLITDGCETPCGSWELNSGPLPDQTVFLTAEPSLQPNKVFLYHLKFTQDIPFPKKSPCFPHQIWNSA